MKPATLMRNTRCHHIRFNAKFLYPKDFRGETLYFKISDASVQKAKYALIVIRSAFYNGVLKSAVMNTTIHDLLIGDVKRAMPSGQLLKDWRVTAQSVILLLPSLINKICNLNQVSLQLFV